MNGSCVVELQRGEQPECPELLCGLRTLRWEASPYHWATRRTEIKITISFLIKTWKSEILCWGDLMGSFREGSPLCSVILID